MDLDNVISSVGNLNIVVRSLRLAVEDLTTNMNGCCSGLK